jgi:hypothetical protein
MPKISIENLEMELCSVYDTIAVCNCQQKVSAFVPIYLSEVNEKDSYNVLCFREYNLYII